MGRGCVLHAFFTITPCSVSTAVNFIDNITVATLANQTSYDRLFEWNRIQNSPENCYAKKFSAFEVNLDFVFSQIKSCDCTNNAGTM